MIKFYKKRYIFFAISTFLILFGIAAALINGIQLDIQFKGGTILKYAYTGEVNSEKAAEIANKSFGSITNAQLQSNLAGQDKKLIISLAGDEALTSQQQQALTSDLNAAFPEAGLSLHESLSVEPYIGKRFFVNGLIAIGLSFLLIMVYVWFRFNRISGLSAGVMSIVALLHDVLIVTTVFIIFKIPLSDAFIAATLTIIGFSINDTIVIYDRLRDNARILGNKITVEELVDKSISQSMSRSINTNLAVFISITIVYIFALIYNIESIKNFALPMMFGTISGCYSTICIAGPLWTMWQNHKNKNRTNKSINI